MSPLCGRCTQALPPFDRIVAPWLYEEQLAFLIQRWKFHDEQWLTALLAALWLSGLNCPPQVDVIIPIPLHWRKLLQRGFNQSHLLCLQLQRRCPTLRHTTLGHDGMCLSAKTSA